ncbi:MAG: NADH:ubiquinone reductase (Na(+)-transporting) subunit B [Porphyromonas sp.]|nr:NADH:ubiquinone reductase (Na(+)-transporting) subunit B [Porphyromonas sp.]
MNGLRKYLDKIKPNFEKGGKMSSLWSTFDGFESFLFVPNTTSKRGVHIHDANDSKRTMIIVVMALIPALLFGMYNVGYQHYLVTGQEAGFWTMFFYGFLAVLPQIIVSYVVGLGIEFAVAQVKHEEVAEGFLVSGLLIPMIVPVETPLWQIAVATAFAVVFAKEVFGGTGYNVLNVALVTRAFLFFAYPGQMSGDSVFIRTGKTFGMGGTATTVDAYTGATPLGQAAMVGNEVPQITNAIGEPISSLDYFIGLIPGSVGETSTIAILLGALLLLVTGVASWKIMISIFGSGFLTALLFNAIGGNGVMLMPAIDHILLGGFAFGAVFMATDPVTASRTETGKWIYGILIGFLAVVIRALNPGYPEGMMLAILLMNVFAPLIDFYVVDANIKKRLNRAKAVSTAQSK